MVRFFRNIVLVLEGVVMEKCLKLKKTRYEFFDLPENKIPVNEYEKEQMLMKTELYKVFDMVLRKNAKTFTSRESIFLANQRTFVRTSDAVTVPAATAGGSPYGTITVINYTLPLRSEGFVHEVGVGYVTPNGQNKILWNFLVNDKVEPGLSQQRFTESFDTPRPIKIPLPSNSTNLKVVAYNIDDASTYEVKVTLVGYWQYLESDQDRIIK